MMSKSGYIWASVALLVVAFSIALIDITYESLWFDEAWTAWAIHYDHVQTSGQNNTNPSIREHLNNFVQDWRSTFENITRDDVHPPLYYLGLNAWVMLLGESELFLRVYSLFWGMLALSATMQLALNLKDRPSALLAGILLASAGFFLYYTREARMYTQLLALSVLACSLCWRYLQHPTHWRGLFLGITLGMLALTQYIALVWIAVLALWCVFSSRSIRQLFIHLIPFVLGGLVSLAWLPFALQQFAQRATNALPLPSDWGTLFALLYQLTTNQLTLFALIILVGSGVMLWQRQHKALAYLLCLSVIPLALLLYVNTITPVFQLRYVIVLWAIGAVWVALSLRAITSWLPFNQLVITLVVLGLAYLQLTQYQWIPKSDWRGTVAWVAQVRLSSEPGLVSYLDSSAVAYYNRQTPFRRGINLDMGWRVHSVDEIQAMAQSLFNSPTLWLSAQTSDPAFWDALSSLQSTGYTGVKFGKSVNAHLFYAFTNTSNRALSLAFWLPSTDETIVFTAPLNTHYTLSSGEQLCVPTSLPTRNDLQMGLYVIQDYNTVVANTQSNVTPEICLTIPSELARGTYRLRLQVFTDEPALVIEGDKQYWGDFIGVGHLNIR
jgi:uncharacterized membrane protein